MQSASAFDAMIVASGLLVDPGSGRIPVTVGDRRFQIEVNSAPGGCLLRCDINRTGPRLDAYRAQLAQLGLAEPGRTEVLLDERRLTIVRHVDPPTAAGLRAAVERLAAMMPVADDLIAMLSAAEAADARISAAPAGRFPDLGPLIDVLAAGGSARAGGESATMSAPGASSASRPTASSARPVRRAKGGRIGPRMFLAVVGMLVTLLVLWAVQRQSVTYATIDDVYAALSRQIGGGMPDYETQVKPTMDLHLTYDELQRFVDQGKHATVPTKGPTN